jgi:hypothetical protein
MSDQIENNETTDTIQRVVNDGLILCEAFIKTRGICDGKCPHGAVHPKLTLCVFGNRCSSLYYSNYKCPDTHPEMSYDEQLVIFNNIQRNQLIDWEKRSHGGVNEITPSVVQSDFDPFAGNSTRGRNTDPRGQFLGRTSNAGQVYYDPYACNAMGDRKTDQRGRSPGRNLRDQSQGRNPNFASDYNSRGRSPGRNPNYASDYNSRGRSPGRNPNYASDYNSRGRSPGRTPNFASDYDPYATKSHY